jgi:phospholipid/cholesterol/gamma-HCH transport system substrate-binding protein
MIFGKTKMELKVGIFVFSGLFILSVFILSIGGFNTWTSGYKVNCVFNFVNGIKLGAPVRFAGVDAGEVKKIKLFFDAAEGKDKVRLHCWIKRTVDIPRDSTVWVNTLGLLGEKYVEIIPGKNYADLVKPGQELIGTDPMPMHEVTQLAKNIGKNIDLTLTRINNKEGTIGKLLFEEKIYNELEAFVVDIRQHPWKLMWRGKD